MKKRTVFIIISVVLVGLLFSPTFQWSNLRLLLKDIAHGSAFNVTGPVLKDSSNVPLYVYESILHVTPDKRYWLRLDTEYKIRGLISGIEVVNEKGLVYYWEDNGDLSRWHEDNTTSVYFAKPPVKSSINVPDSPSEIEDYVFRFKNDGTVKVRFYSSTKFDPACLVLNAENTDSAYF